jgi:hypothetical protein
VSTWFEQEFLVKHDNAEVLSSTEFPTKSRAKLTTDLIEHLPDGNILQGDVPSFGKVQRRTDLKDRHLLSRTGQLIYQSNNRIGGGSNVLEYYFSNRPIEQITRITSRGTWQQARRRNGEGEPRTPPAAPLKTIHRLRKNSSRQARDNAVRN